MKYDNKRLEALNKLQSDLSAPSSPLMASYSEEERARELEESSKAFNAMQEKARQSRIAQQQEEEEEEEEDEEDEDEDGIDDEEEELEEQKYNLFGMLGSFLKKVGLKSLISGGLTIGGVSTIAFLLSGIYRVHYTGEFEFRGITGEYQNFSFKNMNFSAFNKSGDVELIGLTKENKLSKTYYTFYSDKSYYAVVEDSKKYPNPDNAYKRENLLTPDELREQYPDIQDTEGREKMFQLNPDVLYSLDKYLHKDKFIYPQQFTKPVFYEESKENFELKQLTDDTGRVVAKSHLYDKLGKLKQETDLGVWDYGLASVLHYKEFEVPQKQVVNSLGRKIIDSSGKEVSQTLIGKVPSGTTPSSVSQAGESDLGLRDKPAYAIDKAVTAGGTVTSKITQRWQEKAGSRSTYDVTSTIVEQEPYVVDVPVYGHDENGNSIQTDTTQETRYRKHVYTVVDTYEKWTEEYLPFYEGDLDTSSITGSRYYRDYIRNYSNYIPLDVPRQLDYKVFSSGNEKINQLIYDDPNAESEPVGPVNTENTDDKDKDKNNATNSPSSPVNYARTSTLRTTLSNNSRALTVPAPMPGEERSLTDVIKIGSKKDNNAVQSTLKYLPIFQKYGKAYGIDPYILIGMASQESGGNPSSFNGYARGLMQIEHTVKSVTAFNHDTKQIETVTVNHGNLFDVDYNIKIGAMELANRLADYKYNILMSLQGYNYGKAGIASAVTYYLSGGTIGVNHNVNWDDIYAYAEMNHVGWITAQFPGDLPKERHSAWLQDPSDGKHSARCWYSDTGYRKYGQGGGDMAYVDKILMFYAGEGSPFVVKPDGTVVSLDGTGSGSFGAGGNAVTAYNSYMSSNWESFKEIRYDLFPWSEELDSKLAKEAKGLDNANPDELALRNPSLYTSNLTKVDEEIVLNMMFALNQGNYLSKYDYLGEAEWKAMYNQLLSSPTGKTWDDKWIGFTPEDVFGKSLDDLGTLFDANAGISPSVSKPFGKVKNIYTETEGELAQYNEMNFGMDLTIPPDTEILALEEGVITSLEKKSKPLSRYGNFVEIKFNTNTKMIIANLKEVDKKLKVGDKVAGGQIIGKTGGESRSYKKEDLHISLLYRGNYINPEWIITRDMKGFDDPISGTGGVNCGGQSSVSNSPVINKVIEEAKKHIGKPYVWGATGPNSFDCSGFMYYIMKQSGLDVTRLTAIKYREESTEVPREQIQPGDLVFWHNDSGDKHSKVYHVGLFIGDDTVIDCSTDHNGVGTRKLSSLIDKKPSRYFTFGRYAPLSGGGSASTGGSSGCQTPGQLTDNGEYGWPVPSSKNITSKFGPRWGKNHNGIDISAPEGAEVVSSRAGEVIKVNDSCPTTGSYGSRCGGGFGNYVYLKHPDGFVSIYPHMKRGTVTSKVGDKINAGQKVGEIGSSGSSTGNHLHFEIRDGEGKAMDPLKYVQP